MGTWRDRVKEALREKGLSYRETSLSIGCAHGYVHGILEDGKEPTLDRFVRLAQFLDVSLSYLMLGADVSPETEAILAALEDDPAARQAILHLLGLRQVA